ncbi:MAG: DUF72 domain-containing protein, partial [Planctomycetota bacterium]
PPRRRSADPTLARAPGRAEPPPPDLLRGPDAPVRFGTSSFSSKDWVGPFYPLGTPPAAFLAHYARTFDTVEVDSTYYRIPGARTVDGWGAKTPETFLLSAKFPREIVHAGGGRVPDGRTILDPDSTYEARDRFLEVMARLGPRLGPLVLQFPYFNREIFPSAGPFLDRLDRFLADLPREMFRYGVEVRNRAWMAKPLRDLLAKHDVTLVLVDQAWMPHADEVEKRFDPVTSGLVYVRLLGDRKKIEQLTTTWGEEVLDQGPRLERWASFLVRTMDRGVRALVYANNHYAGHGPATVRRLMDLFERA